MKNAIKKSLSIVSISVLSIALLSTQPLAAKKRRKQHAVIFVNNLRDMINCTIQLRGHQCSSLKHNPLRFKLNPGQYKTIYIPHGCTITNITALNKFATGPVSSNAYTIEGKRTFYITSDRGITQNQPKRR